MIGIVIVSHGGLAGEFISVLEHVMGAQHNIIAVGIEADDDIEQRRTDIVNAVQTVDTGDGVIILTDMFGGTPSNLAISIMSRDKIEVLAGVNLPLLIKIAALRKDNTDIPSVVEKAQEAGRKYINVASRLLGE